MEICDDEELSILENNTYLFVSKGIYLCHNIIGEPFDGRACLGAFNKIRLLGEVCLFLYIFLGWLWQGVLSSQQND